VNLDGYNQTDLITGKGPSKRNKIWYFTEGTLSAARIGDDTFRFTDQPTGWFGPTEKVDWPIITNLRLDPWERTGLNQSISYVNWYVHEFWRGVFVQQKVAELGETFVEFHPCRREQASTERRQMPQSRRRLRSAAEISFKSVAVGGPGAPSEAASVRRI